MPIDNDTSRQKWNLVDAVLDEVAWTASPDATCRLYQTPAYDVPDYLAAVLQQRCLTSHFQPIYSGQNGQVLGYEALARPLPGAVGRDGAPLSIPHLFHDAAACGMQAPLDVFCRETAIREAT